MGPSGPSFATIALDGVSWRPDTSFAVLNGALVTISATRLPNPGTPASESLTISLEAFTGPGTYLLSDALTDNQAQYLPRDALGNIQYIYSSRRSHPGRLDIVAFSPADSTVTGTFTVTLFAQTDTTLSHTFVGHFRLRDAI